MTTDEKTGPGAHAGEVAHSIEREAARKIRARSTRRRGALTGFGLFGLVGWSVSVPTLAGLALGIWLDRKLPAQASWTLTFLIIGIGLGCLQAWYWIRQELRRE